MKSQETGCGSACELSCQHSSQRNAEKQGAVNGTKGRAVDRNTTKTFGCGSSHSVSPLNRYWSSKDATWLGSEKQVPGMSFLKESA